MSVVDVTYEDELMVKRAPLVLVESTVQAILNFLDKTESEVACTFVSDASMQELNFTYRGKRESTDILSFAQIDEDDDFSFPPHPEDSKFLGDIVISLDAMERNCEDFTVEVDEELTRLLVHGILHLLGWDHETNDDSEPMLIKQEEMVKMMRKESIA